MNQYGYQITTDSIAAYRAWAFPHFDQAATDELTLLTPKDSS